MDKRAISLELKRKIYESGCQYSGFAKAGLLQREYDFFIKWLVNGNHANKAYLEREPVKRANPALLVNGAKSVISLLFSYHTTEDLSERHYYRISKYGYGIDYHKVLRDKMNDIVGYIKRLTLSENTFQYVDTAPVFEKAWAARCGLGWIGKNTLLINKNLGSFVFIGTVITDVELEYDEPIEDDCGICSLCIDSCPTGALTAPHEIDIRKCISHLTMEQKNALPVQLKEKFNRYIYGCDICQNCCPHNRNLQPCEEKSFYPSELLRNMSKTDWDGLTEDKFNELFHESAVQRITYANLKRNIDFIG